MAKPTEIPADPDMLAGMEGLIAVMRERRPAAEAEASQPESVPTRPSDDMLAGAPWHAIEASPREGSEGPEGSPQGSVLAQGTVIDRYVVLKKLGEGGMGVVYAAYDPELDRKVALKLLRAGTSDQKARARLLREAQALGKLAHPNIVAVHDVGTVDEQVWLAMEFVQGRTLREWLERRPDWREIVRTMRSAGRGLVAAHAAGLLHRDFKPDNVMIGDDGRVRVMDFGLARVGPEGVPSEASSSGPAAEPLATQLTAAGAVVGTPSYMAPEQLENRELTPAADQFAFCVSLWEALYGERPFGGRTLLEIVANVLGGHRRPPPKERAVPTRLRRACERGLALDPRQRWPSMNALLGELRRIAAPGRRWLALGLAGGLATLGGGLALARYVEVMDRCTGGRAELDGIWDEAKRGEVEAAILGTEVVYAPDTWERVAQRLDGYADDWASKHTEVCEATRVTGAQSEAVMELRMGCLREHRTALRAAVGVLGQADAQIVEKAVQLVSALPLLDRCDDVELLEQQRQRVPPPEDPEVAREVEELRERLAGIDAEEAAGKYARALELVEPVVQRAESLEYSPLLAEAKLRRGLLLDRTSRYDDAERELQAAYALAIQLEHDDVAFGAARILTYLVGDNLARPAEGLVWGRTALPLAERRGEGIEVAASLNGLGNVLQRQASFEQAELHHQRALRIRERVLGTDHPLVAMSANNLGNVLDDRGELEQAELHHSRALEIYERALGPDHPLVGASANNLGSVLTRRGELEQAELHHRRALRIWEATLGPDHSYVASASSGLAHVSIKRGEYEEAERHLRRALQIHEKAQGKDHPDLAANLNDLAAVYFNQGKYEAAEQCFRRALELLEKALGADHPHVASSLDNLGVVLGKQGKLEQAVAHYRRALQIRQESLGNDHPHVASSSIHVGNVLEEQGDFEQAELHYQQALRILQKTLGEDHADVAAAHNDLGNVYYRTGSYEQAELQYRRALEIKENALGEDHPDVALPLVGLAEIALARRRFDVAGEQAARAVAIREASESAADLTAKARFVLARALWHDEAARARARALAEQAREAFAEHGKVQESDLAEVETWLAEHPVASSKAR